MFAYLVLEYKMTAVFTVSHFIAFHPLIIVVSSLGRHHGDFCRLAEIHF